jgi:hypothetical protein
MRNAHRILVRKPEGRTPLGRPRRRWEGNIRMDLEILLEIMHCIYQNQDSGQWWALVKVVMNLQFHKKQGIS